MIRVGLALVISISLSLFTPPAKKQLVAHRGASAYAPEHTLEAYRLALEQGADYVEQDLAVTKDGVLVCIHDLTLERTTNVEEVFPDRAVAEGSGAAAVRGWRVHDFTLAEIKRLDAGSWFDKKFAGARIPTFQEAVDLVKGKAGLYPELKDPAFYRANGVKPETLLADALKKNGLPDGRTPVIIQSFDEVTVKQLAKDLPAVPRVILVEMRDGIKLDTADEIRGIASWATGLGPNKAIVEQIPEMVKWAHAAGLTVTPWTFRSASTGKYRSVRDEMSRFLYEFDVDAVFTDNPDQFPRK
jgi:glycerophosphoryl diester phosphodiesterase